MKPYEKWRDSKCKELSGRPWPKETGSIDDRLDDLLREAFSAGSSSGDTALRAALLKCVEALEHGGDCVDHASNCCASWCSMCKAGEAATARNAEAIAAARRLLKGDHV